MKEPLDNINSIYTVKKELKNLLIFLEKEPTDSFATYPDLFIEKLGEIDEKTDYILG